MFGKREGGKGYYSGAGQEKRCVPRFIRNCYSVLYMTVRDHSIGTMDLSRMKNQDGHWVH